MQVLEGALEDRDVLPPSAGDSPRLEPQLLSFLKLGCLPGRAPQASWSRDSVPLPAPVPLPAQHTPASCLSTTTTADHAALDRDRLIGQS